MGFFKSEEFYYLFRMLIASICGIVIGVERKNRAKEAGIRTHCVVACASAMMMIISKYAFGDTIIGENGVRGADGARIAAQVVSGIGFLGAGTIFVHKNTITGLTTAAGIWATSGVGLAIGAGMYFVGVSATVIILFAQIVFHRNIRCLKNSKSKIITVKGVNTPGFQKEFTDKLRFYNVTVHDVNVEKKEDCINYVFTAEIPGAVLEEEIVNLTNFRCKVNSN